LIDSAVRGVSVKVLISADMEGTAGIVDRAHTAIPDRAVVTGMQHNAAEYDWARRLMTEEVNAATTGAFQGGATEVWVTDAHGSMRNLLPLALHREAKYVSGTPKTLCMLEGLDETFGAVMFTGYHGSAGTPASVLAHTYIGIIQDLRLNDVSMGEYGINAAVAGHFRVPVVLVTGDNTVVAQAQSLLGSEVVGVEVKRALGTHAAVHLHPEKARDAIRDGAAERLRPYRVAPPVRLEVDIVSPDLADLASLLPGVTRLGPRSVAYEGPDVLTVFRAWRALLNVMMSRFPV
jgi:D-amino peptidase